MKNKLLIALAALILISIPLTIYLTQQKQEFRSRANATTTLAFSPNSTPSEPIEKKVGESLPIQIMVDPGVNLVTFVKLQVTFDPTKLALSDAEPFVANKDAFPSTIEGPVITGDKLAVSVSIGGDPTKAIQELTELGTLNFRAIGPTEGQPTQVSFTSITQALSSGADDQASENILSAAYPANILITDEGSTTPSVTPRPTLTSTLLTFDLLLHGVGNAGDNPNPSGNSLSNKNPLHPQREFQVTIIDSNNQEVANLTDYIIYSPGDGSFIGSVDLGPNFASGSYSVKVKTDRYLRKLIPGIINIENSDDNEIDQTDLVAGDVKTDNTLNVLDYNILRDCGYGQIEPLPMADPNSIYNTEFCISHNEFRELADVEDNGIINGADYNLFLRELSVQFGD